MEAALELEREGFSRLRALNEAISHGDSDVQKFYSGAAVFITGGSGYMGKQLLEKLLRSCSIKKTYLLLRPKKGSSAEDRLKEILSDPAFYYLHENRPHFNQTIVPIEGDIGQLKLGISDDNWKKITDNVDIIFHAAAIVKFDEALKTAVLMNVRGTREVLHLAKACKQLRSFTYISTAYSNATTASIGTPIREEFYPVPISPEILIYLAETFDEEKLEMMKIGLSEGWLNTYSFTKAVAEELVRTLGSDLPACIVRPAIVIGAYHEPLPGWIEPRAIYGNNGIAYGCLMGVIHVIICDEDVTVNLIPVDYVNNAVIVAGYAAGKRQDCDSNSMMIYNVTSDRTFTWADPVGVFNESVSKMPSPRTIGVNFSISVSSKFGYYALTMLLHYIPAYLVDLVSIGVGKRPWLTKIYNRIHKLSQVIQYFTLIDWQFEDGNTQKLLDSLLKSDRFIYNFDKSTLDAHTMIVMWGLGLRKYVVKDELKGTERGKRRELFFMFLSLCLLFVYVLIVWFFIETIIGLF